MFFKCWNLFFHFLFVYEWAALCFGINRDFIFSFDTMFYLLSKTKGFIVIWNYIRIILTQLYEFTYKLLIFLVRITFFNEIWKDLSVVLTTSVKARPLTAVVKVSGIGIISLIFMWGIMMSPLILSTSNLILYTFLDLY